MSFILDALRKSESERRRSAAPMLAGVPVEVERPAVPVWMWVIIGLLALAVVVLGGAWWSTTRTAPAGTATAVQQLPLEPTREMPAPPDPAASLARAGVAPAPPRESTLLSPPPSPAPRTDGPRTEPDTTGGSARSVESGTAPAIPVTASGPNPGAQAEPAAPPAPADTGRSATARRQESLPTVAEASAAGVDLPPLTLELHVYHDEPASRWVYVNGARYTEGRRLAAGPELVEIVPEGIVIRQSGREFLLLAQ